MPEGNPSLPALTGQHFILKGKYRSQEWEKFASSITPLSMPVWNPRAYSWAWRFLKGTVPHRAPILLRWVCYELRDRSRNEGFLIPATLSLGKVPIHRSSQLVNSPSTNTILPCSWGNVWLSFISMHQNPWEGRGWDTMPMNVWHVRQC